MKIHIVHCFCTKTATSGNPAAVIEDFSDQTSAKQTLATQLNLPVTVFISYSDSQQPLLEFFYPATEMPLCLHGTLAAAFILFKKTTAKQLTCLTRSNMSINISLKNEFIQVQVANQSIPNVVYHPNEICDMLNLSRVDLIETKLPFGIASVGSPKLLVPLKTLQTLTNLKPNFALIKSWSSIHQVNGLYVYAYSLKQNKVFIARGFNPKTGNNEDAATGVAAAALALRLKNSITVKQGALLKRPSEIIVSYESDQHILVGGKVSLCEPHNFVKTYAR